MKLHSFEISNAINDKNWKRVINLFASYLKIESIMPPFDDLNLITESSKDDMASISLMLRDCMYYWDNSVGFITMKLKKQSKRTSIYIEYPP